MEKPNLVEESKDDSSSLMAKENQALKAENKKLNYRVVHLLRALDEFEAAAQTTDNK